MGIKTVLPSTAAGAVPCESDIQKQLFAMLALVRTRDGLRAIDYIYAVPNGTMFAGTPKQRAQYANSLKAQGLKPGVSDIAIALPRGKYHGAYIELKRDKRTSVTDEQRAWLARVESVGYFSALAIGFDEAYRTITDYLNLEPWSPNSPR